MHNTIGDVALTNISRETISYHDFVEYAKQRFLAFCSASGMYYVLSMFLNFGRFSASSCSCEKSSCKKRVYMKTGSLSELNAKLLSLCILSPVFHMISFPVLNYLQCSFELLHINLGYNCKFKKVFYIFKYMLPKLHFYPSK